MLSARIRNALFKRQNTWKAQQSFSAQQTFGQPTLTSYGVGSVPAAIADYVTAEETGDGAHHRTVLTFDALAITTTDNGTAGHGGGTKVYDFPQGMIVLNGTAQRWTSITVDGTGLPNDSAMEIGLGTTVATSAMGSLTGTTEDIVTGDAFTLSSSLSAVNRLKTSVSAGAYLDGSSTAKDAYLNISCSAATADADGTTTLSGTVTIFWSNLGTVPA